METPHLLADEFGGDSARDFTLQVGVVVKHHALPVGDLWGIAAVIREVVVEFAPLDAMRLQPFHGLGRAERAGDGEGSVVLPCIAVRWQEVVGVAVGKPAETWPPAADVPAQQQLQVDFRSWLEGEIAENHLHALLVIGAEAEGEPSACAPQRPCDSESNVALRVVEADHRDDSPVADIAIVEVESTEVAERGGEALVRRPGHQRVWWICVGDFHLQKA